MEYRVHGPPGTGKTTWLSRQVVKDVERYGHDSIIVSSFTRAAAAEAAGRDLPLPREHVCTVHALCYRALGRPTIAETKIAEWNEANPDLALADESKRDIDDPYNDAAQGNKLGAELYAAMNLARAQLRPIESWSGGAKEFHRRWTDWKDETGYIDFTDMLEFSLRDQDAAPGSPSVYMLDEAQDADPLMLALVRKWGKACERLYLVGDADQSIYGFKGASPRAFLSPALPAEQERVLARSHRLSRAVHAYARDWLSQIRSYAHADYAPRDEDGAVSHIGATWRRPEMLADTLAPLLDTGKTIMILGACAYFLQPTISWLRAEGIPFHNPWRRKNGAWNPLYAAHGVNVAERLRAYLRPQTAGRMWTYEEAAQWGDLLMAQGVYQRGGKSELARLGKERDVSEVDLGELLGIFTEEAFGHLFDMDMAYLLDHCIAAKRKPLEYATSIVRRFGAAGIEERRTGKRYDNPQVTVGTIHSVKGAEADAVVVFPDLSVRGHAAWRMGAEARDEIVRVFYVALTRARETLHICQGALGQSSEILPQYLRRVYT